MVLITHKIISQSVTDVYCIYLFEPHVSEKLNIIGHVFNNNNNNFIITMHLSYIYKCIQD